MDEAQILQHDLDYLFEMLMENYPEMLTCHNAPYLVREAFVFGGMCAIKRVQAIISKTDSGDDDD